MPAAGRHEREIRSYPHRLWRPLRFLRHGSGTHVIRQIFLVLYATFPRLHLRKLCQPRSLCRIDGNAGSLPTSDCDGPYAAWRTACTGWFLRSTDGNHHRALWIARGHDRLRLRSLFFYRLDALSEAKSADRAGNLRTLWCGTRLSTFFGKGKSPGTAGKPWP